MEPARRKSPGWVRELPSTQIHGIALHLMQREQREDLSERQIWLWEALISELEYRWRQARPLERCSCALCIAPFLLDED